MLPGKVPPAILERLVFTRLGQVDDSVILGPELGEDASLIRIGGRVLVASTDPITGSIEDIGWLAVHINANDVATFGVVPRWFLVSIMLPIYSTSEHIERIMNQIHGAAFQLGVAVAGGHTEVTEGIDRPIVAGFMLGETEEGRYVTSRGAKAGDSIIVTKSIALEGTSILASECHSRLVSSLGEDVLKEARSMRDLISVVKEGVSAFETGHLTAMHDPTEGGIAGGLHELCDASGVGFEVEMDRIPLVEPTRLICDELRINPLELISSGCMVITCNSEFDNEVVGAINSKGIKATIIGTVLADSEDRRLVSKSGSEPLARPETDALWNALKQTKDS
ncbi:MAG: hydrogenase [Candidatus Thorarchaeota archaeon]|nr:MAG: hydrogenase [Candidatus Thorarchaeota archaeon]